MTMVAAKWPFNHGCMARWAWVVLVLGAGCSSEEPKSQFGTGPATTSAAFFGQLCEAFAGCCGRKTAPGCVAMTSGAGTPATYVPSRGDACLADLRGRGSAICADDFQLPALCAGAFPSAGTAKPGEACGDRDDCAEASEGVASCVGGRCEVTRPGAVGDGPCTSSGTSGGGPAGTDTTFYLCDPKAGARCDPTSRTCQPSLAAGAPCTGVSVECISGTFCDAGTKVCTPQATTGSPCAGLTWGECAGTAYCDEATKTCKPRLPAGSACTQNEQCVSFECANREKRCGPSGWVYLACGG